MEKTGTRDAGCSSKSLDDRKSEDFQTFNDIDESDDDNPQNLSDSFDDMPVSDDEDVQLSSPSNSLNSDVDQRWYAFRGRWGVNVDNNNHIDLDNQRLPANNQALGALQQPQEEEETDFLEMDFEPDTNSEIENEATIPNDPQIASNTNSFNFHPSLPLPQPPEFLLNTSPQKAVPVAVEPDIFLRPVVRNTGAKPKQASTIVRPAKPSKQVTDGDNVFRISTLNNNNNHIASSPSLCHPSSFFRPTSRSDEVYNLGASSSRASSNHNDRSFNESLSQDHNGFMKVHKSPAKSSGHHNHKHQRLHEEQNDQFLFEIEPLKPRNSVTIYTTNCDEKILVDALVSLGWTLVIRSCGSTNYLNLFLDITESGTKPRNRRLILQQIEAISYRRRVISGM